MLLKVLLGTCFAVPIARFVYYKYVTKLIELGIRLREDIKKWTLNRGENRQRRIHAQIYMTDEFAPREM